MAIRIQIPERLSDRTLFLFLIFTGLGFRSKSSLSLWLSYYSQSTGIVSIFVTSHGLILSRRVSNRCAGDLLFSSLFSCFLGNQTDLFVCLFFQFMILNKCTFVSVFVFCRWEMSEFNEIPLHGTLHATIFEIDRLHSGGAPKFFRKVYHFTLCVWLSSNLEKNCNFEVVKSRIDLKKKDNVCGHMWRSRWIGNWNHIKLEKWEKKLLNLYKFWLDNFEYFHFVFYLHIGMIGILWKIEAKIRVVGTLLKMNIFLVGPGMPGHVLDTSWTCILFIYSLKWEPLMLSPSVKKHTIL